MLISASMIVCERILQEVDNVASAIRMADLYFLDSSSPEAPNSSEIARLYGIASAKFDPDDSEEHNCVLMLTSPDGENKEVFTATAQLTEKKFPGTPTTINIFVTITLGNPMWGTFYVSLVVDEKLVARTCFTFVRKPEQVQIESGAGTPNRQQ